MTARRSLIPSLPPGAEETARSARERRRLLSSSRLRLSFTLFVVALLLALSGLIFVLVSQIFNTLTPTIRSDLEWKARRGAGELVHATELGIVVADAHEIKNSLSGYDRDPDIMAIVVTDMAGKVLATHGVPPESTAQLFSGPARSLRVSSGHYVSWAEAAIEGGPVGRVAVVVSTARLKAGDELKRSILFSAGVGGAVAFIFALLFVSLYIGPIIRVTENAFTKLERTTAKALEAARLKSEFLANMSHEIRTPMNGVLGMIELLSRTGLDEKQRRFLGTLQTSAGGLMSVLNDILDFSKIEAGKMELREENCRVRGLIDEVTELFAARTELRGVKIAAIVEADVPSQVEADTERVRQVLSNLVGNAVKFTESGTITVRACVEESKGALLQLRFEVKDTGIGIDPALQGKLFEAFSQVDGSLTRKHGGTGLGLAICKQLVSLMKGRIGVTSELGKGSTFWFVLPLRRLESAGTLVLPTTKPLAPPPSSKDNASNKILVAEDNPINQEVIREVLSELGYEAEIVENGVQALRALEQEAYPLVLMDCQMPELDGYGAAREVRRRETGTRRIPLIAVTAHAFEGEREKALSSGMDDYVTKPISAAILSEVIQRWWPKSLNHEPESGERLASIRVAAMPPDPALVAAPPALDPSVTRSPAVARVFLKHVPAQITSIGQALEAGDLPALQAAAHKLKGSCLAVGVPRMAQLCAALEEGSADRPADFAELKRVFARAEAELTASVAAGASSAAG